MDASAIIAYFKGIAETYLGHDDDGPVRFADESGWDGQDDLEGLNPEKHVMIVDVGAESQLRGFTAGNPEHIRQVRIGIGRYAQGKEERLKASREAEAIVLNLAAKLRKDHNATPTTRGFLLSEAKFYEAHVIPRQEVWGQMLTIPYRVSVNGIVTGELAEDWQPES